MSEKKYTALYIRVSKEIRYKKTSDSVENQKKILSEFARENNFKNLKFFIDKGYSGTNFERPQFEKMLAYTEQNKISTIIVKDLSRLGRNYLWTGLYVNEIFQNLNVRFISITDNQDSDDEKDFDFLIPFKNIMNEWYAYDTSVKVKKVKKRIGEEGKPLAVNPPYGYIKSKDDKYKWIIDKDAAKIVRLIFELKTKNFGLRKIAKHLEESKVLTPTEYAKSKNRIIPSRKKTKSLYKWNNSTIYKMLKNESYLGHTINFKTYRRSFKDSKKRHKDKTKQVKFENTHQAIIDKNIFEIANKRKNK